MCAPAFLGVEVTDVRCRVQCVFSSTTAYVPQAPWIMNATLRQNVIFGLEEDEQRWVSTLNFVYALAPVL